MSRAPKIKDAKSILFTFIKLLLPSVCFVISASYYAVMYRRLGEYFENMCAMIVQTFKV